MRVQIVKTQKLGTFTSMTDFSITDSMSRNAKLYTFNKSALSHKTESYWVENL